MRSDRRMRRPSRNRAFAAFVLTWAPVSGRGAQKSISAVPSQRNALRSVAPSRPHPAEYSRIASISANLEQSWPTMS